MGIDRHDQTGHTLMEAGLQAFKVVTWEWVWVGIDRHHQAGGTPRETGVQVLKVFTGEWVLVGIDRTYTHGDRCTTRSIQSFYR